MMVKQSINNFKRDILIKYFLIKLIVNYAYLYLLSHKYDFNKFNINCIPNLINVT